MSKDPFFDLFAHSAFRIETLPQYLVEADREFAAFRDEGRLIPVSERPAKQDWMARTRKAVASGKRIYRVHIMRRPLSTYLEYELARYPENVAGGEEVNLAEYHWHPDLEEITEDFWLYDAETDRAFVEFMRYDAEGHFLGTERSDSPDAVARCVTQRDLALAHAVPLDEYLTNHHRK